MLKNFRNLLKILRILLSVCPIPTVFMLLVSFVSGILSPAITLLMGQIAGSFELGGADKKQLFVLVVAIAIVSTIGTVCNAINRFLEERIGCVAEKPVKKRLLTRVSELSYRWRELEENANKIELACDQAVSEGSLEASIGSISTVISTIISVGSSILIVMRVNVIIALIVPFVLLITTYLSYIGDKRYMQYQFEDETDERRQQAVFAACLDKHAAAEMRIAHKTRWLTGKWAALYRLAARKTIRRKTVASVFEELGPFCVTLGTLLLTALFVLAFRGTGYAASDIVIIISAFVAMGSCMAELAVNIDYMMQNGAALNYYFDLFDDTIPLAHKDHADISAPSVSIDHVSFSYGETPVIQDIDVHIKSGEHIAIVGENGSGKTTFAKLVLGLYTPTAGEIRFSSGNQVFHACRLTGILQDYAKYELRARENIGLGDYRKMHEDDALTGIYESICGGKLFMDLDTPLGARFVSADGSPGSELSGGQWQKLALSRTFLRHASLIVLDEPNAAIDPLAEAELIRRLFRLAADKTCIFITHRLTTTALADRIIVMKDGHICEEGTHDELMRRNESYAQMYTIQASMYMK